jgi:hypothetical protein
MGFRWRLLPWLLIAIAVALPGCITRTVREGVVEENDLEIVLRSERKGGKEIERHFQQPATISAQRLSNILGALTIEDREGKVSQQRAAIAYELLAPVSEGLSQAFAEADANQEIAVKAVRKEHRLGIFHRKYLTSFVTFLRDDYLYVFLSRIDWEIPKRREDDHLPEPRIGDRVMDFRTVPGGAILQNSSRSVLVRWQDPVFRRAVVERSASDDERRRTVLMESPIPAEELEAQEQSLPRGLSAETLRALADLEEARQAGEITESEYQRRYWELTHAEE